MAHYKLYLSTFPNEFFCTGNHANLGVERGHLQYKVNKEMLKEIPTTDSEMGKWKIEELTIDNFKKALTYTKKQSEWELILLMSATDGDEIWYKSALKNKKTNEIATLTSTNKESNILSRGNRAVKSHFAGWFVGHYRMTAPMCFWNELKKKL
jgi:hypothetical protein